MPPEAGRLVSRPLAFGPCHAVSRRSTLRSPFPAPACREPVAPPRGRGADDDLVCSESRRWTCPHELAPPAAESCRTPCSTSYRTPSPAIQRGGSIVVNGLLLPRSESRRASNRFRLLQVLVQQLLPQHQFAGDKAGRIGHHTTMCVGRRRRFTISHPKVLWHKMAVKTTNGRWSQSRPSQIKLLQALT